MKKVLSKGFHEMASGKLIAEGYKRAKLEKSGEKHPRQREQQMQRPWG